MIWPNLTQVIRRAQNAVENKGGWFGTLRFLLAEPWKLRYLFTPAQRQNWYCDIVNLDEAALFVSSITGCEFELTHKMIDEIRRNANFKADLDKLLGQTRYRPQRDLPLGRRLAWYAIVRIARPVCCVETGVHDGLGSSVILLALEENHRQYGDDGRLISIDLPSADLPTDFPACPGWLIPESLRHRHQLLIGNSRHLLPRVVAENAVDFFIHDSDHSPEHERFELQTIWPAVSPGGIIMTDNGPDVLRGLSQHFGTPFFSFREQISGSLYSGASNSATVKT